MSANEIVKEILLRRAEVNNILESSDSPEPTLIGELKALEDSLNFNNIIRLIEIEQLRDNFRKIKSKRIVAYLRNESQEYKDEINGEIKSLEWIQSLI